MEISAQGIRTNEFLAKLRDILASKRGTEVSIDITGTSAKDAKKIQAFVHMTGCRARIEKANDLYVIHVTGSPCCI